MDKFFRFCFVFSIIGVIVISVLLITDNNSDNDVEKNKVSAESVEYNGHSYLILYKGAEKIGIVHNPDCKCNNK